MKIAVVKKISQNLIEEFTRDKIGGIIFCQIDSKLDYEILKSKFELIHAFGDSVNLNWFNFELTSAKLEKILKKLPGLFVYNSVDLMPALKKDLFWSSVFEHSLLFQVNKYKLDSNEIVFYEERSALHKKLSLVRKLFLNNDEFYSIAVEGAKKEYTNKIAFRVNDAELIPLLGNLLTKIGTDNIISFQTRVIKKNDSLIVFLSKWFSGNIAANSVKSGALKMNGILKMKLLFMKEDSDFLINFINTLFKLYNHVDEYEKLFKTGIKKVVLNAGENEGEGVVVCALAKKFNVKTFNYMNGTKARDPQNVDTYFDYWFMPDKKTQELILSYCKVEKEQVPITGHLLKEVAEKHVYTGTLDEFISRLENKKVIVVFTSKVFINEAKDVISFLVKYLELHPNVVVLLRKHPAETDSYSVSNDRFIELPKAPLEEAQTSLFDLLQKANFSISFSSTVSYQSSWFNIPTVNYEVSESSRLPFVDNVKIMHINNLNNLNLYLDERLLKNEKFSSGEHALNTSQLIADIMLN